MIQLSVTELTEHATSDLLVGVGRCWSGLVSPDLRLP